MWAKLFNNRDRENWVDDVVSSGFARRKRREVVRRKTTWTSLLIAVSVFLFISEGLQQYSSHGRNVTSWGASAAPLPDDSLADPEMLNVDINGPIPSTRRRNADASVPTLFTGSYGNLAGQGPKASSVDAIRGRQTFGLIQQVLDSPTGHGSSTNPFNPTFASTPAMVLQRSDGGDLFVLEGVQGNCDVACSKNGTRWAARSQDAPHGRDALQQQHMMSLLTSPADDVKHRHRTVENDTMPAKSSSALSVDSSDNFDDLGGRCLCRCASPHPAFREDVEECVDRLSECETTEFVDGEKTQHLPVVILPMEGQLIYPTSRIALSDVQRDGKIVKAPVCAVTDANVLKGASWVALHKFVLPEVPARNNDSVKPSQETPFRLYRDLDNTFLQWLGSASLREEIEGSLVRVMLMCRDDAEDATRSRGSIFRPCVGFRVSGSPHSPYFHLATLTTDPKTSSSVLMDDDGGLMGVGPSSDDGISDYVIIGVCAGIVTLIYVVAVFIYVRIRHTRRLRRRREQSSLEKAAALAAQRQQEEFMRNKELSSSTRSHHGGGGGGKNIASQLLAGKEHQPVLKFMSGVRSARLTQNTVQGLRQHLEEANASDAAKLAELTSKSLSNNGSSNSSQNSNYKRRHSDEVNGDNGVNSAAPATEKAPDALVTIEAIQIDSDSDGSDASGPKRARSNNGRLSKNPDEPEYAELQKVGGNDDHDASSSERSSRESRRSSDSTDGKKSNNKLYFNPAFFEPENLAAPPPGAIEFLNRVREMMAMAKTRMDSKRYEPSLQEIPEEGAYESMGSPPSSASATPTTFSATTITSAMAIAMKADMSGAFDNPGFKLEATAAEIRSFFKFSGGLLGRLESQGSAARPNNGPTTPSNGDKVHRWLEGICNQLAATPSPLPNEDYPNSYDSGVSTGDGGPDSLSTASDSNKRVTTPVNAVTADVTKPNHQKVPAKAPSKPPAAAPGVRPPRKRNPKYETTPSRRNMLKEAMDAEFASRRPQTPDTDVYAKFREQQLLENSPQPSQQQQNSNQRLHQRSVDRLNEILHEAESKMPKIKGALLHDDENKIRVKTEYPAPATKNSASEDDIHAKAAYSENHFRKFLPQDDEITASNPVFRLEKSPALGSMRPKFEDNKNFKTGAKNGHEVDSDNSAAVEESNGVSEIYVNNTFESDSSQQSTLNRPGKFQRSNSIGAVPTKEITGTCKLLIEVTETCTDSEPETTSAKEPGAEHRKKPSRIRRKISRKESFLDSLERPKNGKLSRKPSIVQDSLERPVVKKKQQENEQSTTGKVQQRSYFSSNSRSQPPFLPTISNANEYSDNDSLGSSNGRHYRTFGDFKAKPESSAEESDYSPIEIRTVPPSKTSEASGKAHHVPSVARNEGPDPQNGVWRANSFLLPNYWQKSFKGKMRKPPNSLSNQSFAPDSLMIPEGAETDEDNESFSGESRSSPDSVLTSSHTGTIKRGSKAAAESGRRHSTPSINPAAFAQGADGMAKSNSASNVPNRQSHDILQRFENISKDMDTDRNNGLSQGMLIALNLRSKLVEKYGKDFEKRYFGGNGGTGAPEKGDTFRARLKKLVRTESCDSILKDGSGIKKYKSVDEVLAQLKQCSNMCSQSELPNSTQSSPMVAPNGIQRGGNALSRSHTTNGLPNSIRSPTNGLQVDQAKSPGMRMLLKMLEEQQQKSAQNGIHNKSHDAKGVPTGSHAITSPVKNSVSGANAAFMNR